MNRTHNAAMPPSKRDAPTGFLTLNAVCSAALVLVGVIILMLVVMGRDGSGKKIPDCPVPPARPQGTLVNVLAVHCSDDNTELALMSVLKRDGVNMESTVIMPINNGATAFVVVVMESAFEKAKAAMASVVGADAVLSALGVLALVPPRAGGVLGTFAKLPVQPTGLLQTERGENCLVVKTTMEASLLSEFLRNNA